MDFMKEYEKWLASPALSDAERAELESIRNDPKEIESRFYGPLEFGTAGLRVSLLGQQSVLFRQTEKEYGGIGRADYSG